jgi:hypothetical protein
VEEKRYRGEKKLDRPEAAVTHSEPDLNSETQAVSSEEPEHVPGKALNQKSSKMRESAPKSRKATGPNGVPTSGPQVFGCEYCRARFDDYDEFRKHKRDEHGA